MKKGAFLVIALVGLLSGLSVAEEQKSVIRSIGAGIRKMKVENSAQNMGARIQLWWLLSTRIAGTATIQPKPVVVTPMAAKKTEQLYGPHKKTRKQMEQHNQDVRNRGAQTGDHMYKTDSGSVIQF